MEAKVGMLERLRRVLGGSPAGEHSEHGSARSGANDPYQAHIDALCDTARNLCSDVWLANKINLEVRKEGGKTTLVPIPQESLPYVKAAYEIMQPGLPENVRTLFSGVAS
jgi:hypothetical protein